MDIDSYISKRKDILERIKKLIIIQLNLNLEENEIDNDAPLFGMGLGLDSIDALDLIVGLEREFGIKIKESEVSIFRSVNSLVDYIMGNSPFLDLRRVEHKTIESDVLYAYNEMRENTAVLFRDNRFSILEIKMREGVLDYLSNLIVGKVYTLDYYKMMHTMVLREDGKILDIIYIMPFEDKIWLLVTKFSRGIFIDQFENMGIKDISDHYEIIGIEGAFSWKFVKENVGAEILGLTYLRMYEWNRGDNKVIVTRAGITGEYGYRLFIEKNKVEDVVNKFISMGIKEISMEVMEKVFFICAHEFRFPIIQLSVKEGSSVCENELRWMVDWRRDNFVGREKIWKEKEDFSHSFICFVFTEGKDFTKEEEKQILEKGEIYIENNTIIGKITELIFSPKEKVYFGYARIKKEWAYVGIYFKVRVQDKEYSGVTVTTPIFFTKSSKIVIE